MRVVVLGAGGTGGLYGGLLARAGHDVCFLARGPHLAAIRARGLTIRSAQFGTFTLRAPATENPSQLGQADLVLMAVKTPDLAAASQAAKSLLAPGATLLTLQNGLEAPDEVAGIVGREPVLTGTTGLEATIAEPGVVAHLNQSHFLRVAELDGPPTPRVEQLVATLRNAGINASVATDGRRALWEKAAFLVPLAGMTAVCASNVGTILSLPETRALLDEVAQEVAEVARAHGYDVTKASFDQMPPTMKASMARDFERGKPTELEALTGAVVRMAEAKQVPVPANRTIYAILKLRAGSNRVVT
jgi:2-dehydropantoate 2-reductase